MSKPFYAPGSYIAEVTKQALGKAKTNTKMFVLTFKVLGTPTDDGSYERVATQYERSIFRYLTPAAVEFAIEDLKELGYTQASFGPLDPAHPQHHSFVGQQIEVNCEIEQSQDYGEKERWFLARQSGGLQVNPLDAKEIRELDALFGKNLKVNGSAPKPKNKAQTATEPEPFNPQVTDDDVPF